MESLKSQKETERKEMTSAPRAFLGGTEQNDQKRGEGADLKRMPWVYVFAKPCSLPTCSFKTEHKLEGNPG